MLRVFEEHYNLYAFLNLLYWGGQTLPWNTIPISPSYCQELPLSSCALMLPAGTSTLPHLTTLIRLFPPWKLILSSRKGISPLSHLHPAHTRSLMGLNSAHQWNPNPPRASLSIWGSPMLQGQLVQIQQKASPFLAASESLGPKSCCSSRRCSSRAAKDIQCSWSPLQHY